MRKDGLPYILKTTIILGLGLIVGGCTQVDTPYTPKELEKQARSVSVIKNTPYNCRLLGEAEGKDSTKGKRATYEDIRDGALNDLRNTAYDIVGDKRAMVAITNETMRCSKTGGSLGGKSNSFECKPSDKGGKINIESYRIYAQVFECGER